MLTGDTITEYFKALIFYPVAAQKHKGIHQPSVNNFGEHLTSLSCVYTHTPSGLYPKGGTDDGPVFRLGFLFHISCIST